MAFVFEGIYNGLKLSCILIFPLTQSDSVIQVYIPIQETGIDILKLACSAAQNPVLSSPN